MPTYDYQCDACGHTMELFQSMSASPKRKCPACGKLKLRRLIGTGAGIIFKGGGFYETDYRSDSYNKAAKADADAAKPKSDSKTESKDSKKSDTKSAAKSPKKTSKKAGGKSE